MRLRFARSLIGYALSASVAWAAVTVHSAEDDWRQDSPGRVRHIRIADLPPPYATSSSGNASRVVARPAGARLDVPRGFEVAAFATTLQGPRRVQIAPNGDVFVAETHAGRLRVLRAKPGASGASLNEIFASALDGPFGIAFYPPGNPEWVYVALHNQIVRFAYQAGDSHARSAPEVVIPKLAGTIVGHSTRDIVFSPDGSRMFVSVGSGSNVAEGETRKSAAEVSEWQGSHALGADWGGETNRADVLEFDSAGKLAARVFAAGIRNCVGLTVQPGTGDLWCTTNERDALGDNLVPDYSTRVREGAFYGWPWYYLGSHEDPRHAGERPDLAGKVTVPDVLYQSHSAPLTLAFYETKSGVAAFPREYVGDAFVAMHGSWNRSRRTGYKVVRLPMKNGIPTGEYQDFLTGFVVDDDSVWGRPVGVAVAVDGALLVSDDASNTLWRVSPQK
jgi:glucose/arabinose dehydrogenase